MSSYLEKLAASIRAVADGSSGDVEQVEHAAAAAKKLQYHAARANDARSVAAALTKASLEARHAAASLHRFQKGGHAFADSLAAHGHHNGPGDRIRRGMFVIGAVANIATADVVTSSSGDSVGIGQTSSEMSPVRGIVKSVAEMSGEDVGARKDGDDLGEATDVVHQQTSGLDVDLDDVRRGGQG